jgi:transposase
MPLKDVILNLPGFSIKKMTGFNPVLIDVHYRRRSYCVHCESKHIRKKASYTRLVKHESIGLRRTVLRIKAHKFYCRDCKRYFNQRFPGIVKYQRATEKLRRQVFHHHTQGVSQKSLSQDLAVGKATIERWYHHYYVIENQHIKERHCPSVLGIDEHFFSKKTRFATTLCDLRKHKVFDVVPGRSAADLKDYLLKLPGKERVKVVCIDLSSSYRSLIKQYFPQAKIVADRFHVIRLLNHHALQTYHSIDPNLKYQRGLLSALRTRPDKLSTKQILKRNHYFEQQPAIAAVDAFKQKFHRLLMIKHRTAKQCRRLLRLFLDWLTKLKNHPFEPLGSLYRTFYKWREEIVRMWRFTKNNGITEGFHRKMKLIQRRAYGFRNFQNYRLRVRVLCS